MLDSKHNPFTTPQHNICRYRRSKLEVKSAAMCISQVLQHGLLGVSRAQLVLNQSADAHVTCFTSIDMCTIFSVVTYFYLCPSSLFSQVFVPLQLGAEAVP